jgi:hypothetical protein
VGSTGIEVAAFYSTDYPLVEKDPNAFPHYYFYEMGRNYYVFGDRHSVFVTGFAVFMRYFCMDALDCEDPDATTRRTIEELEDLYAQSNLSFLQGFTQVTGLGEWTPRLKDKSGKVIDSSGQAPLYASVMLRFRRKYGGDAWVRRFYRYLDDCPEIKPENRDSALRQSVNWVVAASCAARQDLTREFVDRWRMPLGPRTRGALQAVDWRQKGLKPADILRDLPIEFTGPQNVSVAAWQKLPGSAIDIGAGADGSVWVVGTKRAPRGGNTIHRWGGSDWEEVEGGASAITVDGNGLPWVVNSSGELYRGQ